MIAEPANNDNIDATGDAAPGDGAREKLFKGTVLRLLTPIADFLTDPDVSEVLINGADEIYVERRIEEEGPRGKPISRARLLKTDRAFRSAHDLEAAARAIAQYSGKLLTPTEQSIEARLYDKSRVHIVQAPAARNGLCIAIRRFSKAHHTVAKLIEIGSISPEIADFLHVAMALKKNVLVSGGTSTGKTTILNAISEFMGDADRVIVIEDVNELDIRPAHSVYFEAQKPDRFGQGGITIRDLFKASLRMRPDRILVGECRGGEALDMIQAMTSGHSGSMTTVHADTPADALNRLETLALMSDVALPQRALRAQIASAVDVIVQLQRVAGRRLVSEVAEIGPLAADGTYRLATVFEKTEAVYDPDATGGFTHPTGHTVAFADDGQMIARQIGLGPVAGIDDPAATEWTKE